MSQLTLLPPRHQAGRSEVGIVNVFLGGITTMMPEVAETNQVLAVFIPLFSHCMRLDVLMWQLLSQLS
jgi:hypothetical protein